MEQQALKYLQIRHWNYWWGVYQCGTSTPACPNAVEFALTDDKAGSVPFFHFDFYTLPGLREILRDSSFMEPEDPDYPAFLHKTEDLQLGKIPYFIGGLYYRHFTPDLAFCNQSLSSKHTLLDLRAPSAWPPLHRSSPAQKYENLDTAHPFPYTHSPGHACELTLHLSQTSPPCGYPIIS